MHVYARRISQDERTSLSVIAAFIDDDQTVLDLGMGSGALGRHLKTQKNATVDGLTLNPDEAELATGSYRRVVVADLDSVDLDAAFESTTYDWIVCADVLEHLKFPERLLAQCQARLNPGGHVITSIPNVAYCGLLAELMQGDFRYREEGLLDATHLRFFTRRSLHRWFEEQGWHLVTAQTIERSLGESEFKVAFDALPPSVARYLQAQPDALSYQFISVATPPGRAPSATLLAHGDTTSHEPANGVFSVQIYLNSGEGYREDQKMVGTGVVGQTPQTITFDLPPRNGDGHYASLRLDPADRPGFMHFFAMELVDHNQNVLWHWSASAAHGHGLDTSRTKDILFTNMWPTTQGVLALIHGEDPQIELPIDTRFLRTIAENGGTLRMSIGWPMSSDYLLAASAAAAQQATIDSLSLAQETLSTQNAQLQEAHRELQHLHDALTRSQQHTVAALRDAERASLDWQHQHRQLEEHLHWIEQSTVFRATRPLVALKMRLDKAVGKPSRAPSLTTTVLTESATQAPPTPQVVGVIVPVYRGLDDTQTCLESVVRSQCTTPYQLIVINDCSPEPEVTQWLRSFAMQHEHVVLLENEDNLGFVRTANKGMAYAGQHDVVLLNSDAEVANDWLDRLQRAAYSKERVASVTPFSNNATICSYPRFCESNDMPLGLSVADMDELCANVLANRSVEIPTGHGFCMYIRRACLDDVGLFDEAHFGKGYGEENDLCVRAAEKGWTHLHALDVFVRHAGGVSFGSSKSERELQAMDTLRRLHPQYEPAVHRFIQQDPAQAARLALDIARVVSTGRRVVLNVTHNRDGGTLRHQLELATRYGASAVFLRLKPCAQGVVLEMTGHQEALELVFDVPTQLDTLRQTLRQLGVAHIHYHHLLGHDDWVLTLPSWLGVTHDFTAHDYYSYCPQISLTDHTDRYCGEQGPDQCRQCLQRNPAPDELSIEAWRERHQPLLAQARVVLAPTASTARRIQRHVPAARIKVAPHLDMIDTPASMPQPRPCADERPLKVAVLGALSRIKGADVLEEAAVLAARRDAPIEFHLIGYGYRHLSVQPKAKLSVHGAYLDGDLPQLLEWLQPDLVWFPAQWPETYSYTLSACLAAGLPIVAPELGAFSDRLKGRPWTWLAPWQQTPAQWLELLLTLRARHFVTGQAPAVCAPEEVRHEWDYDQHYLADLPAAPRHLPEQVRALAQAWLPFQRKKHDAKKQTPLLLHWLAHLRATPGLSFVARRIPGHWQRRVKNWLTS